MNAIIIDDEENAQIALAVLLSTVAPDMKIDGSFSSLEEACIGILKKRPDVVFLDIHMAGESGFDLWKYFPTPDFNIIFTTAYSEYAIKAIRLSALDYLLKPIDIDELRQVVEKLRSQRSLRNINERLVALEENLKSNYDVSQIVVPTHNSLNIVRIAEIIRLESDDNYTRFFLKDKTEYLVSKTLKEFEKILPIQSFVRIHQSHLINLNFLKKYIKGKTRQVEMMDGKRLTVSKERKDVLLALMGRL